MNKALLLLITLVILAPGCTTQPDMGQRIRESEVDFKFLAISEGMTRDDVSITLNNFGKTIRTAGNKITRRHNFSGHRYLPCNRYIVVVFVSGGLVRKSIYDDNDNCLDTREFKGAL